MDFNDIDNIEGSPLNAYEVTYGELPPEVEYYMSMPGVNPNKVLEWFNLGIAEPQTFNQARLLAEAVGYNPEQAKVVAAQWQMESAGGSKLSSPYNYFGIKSHNEAVRNRLAERGINVLAGKEAATTEGAGKASKSSFMEFNNAFEGFAAHKAFLETNARYSKALAAENAKQFAVSLEKAGYATAPNYGTRLYQDYVAPKEKNPKAGDARPKSLGETKSEKIKPFSFTSPSEPVSELPPVSPMRLEVEPQISLDPTQTKGMYGFTPYEQKVEQVKATSKDAPAGFFGSGKTMFNKGGSMNFKSKGAYKNWLGYIYANKLDKPGGAPVTIAGQPHKVERNDQYGGHLFAAGGSFNNPGFNALPAEVQNKIRSNFFAQGGEIGSQLTEFDGGFKHDDPNPQNVFSGIPQGMAPDKKMNIVEKGESRFGDYIFSDTLKVTKEIAQDFNFPPSIINKTFAEASKTFDLKDSRRENDKIEADYREKMLNSLVEAQETFKAEQEAKDFAMMAEKYPEKMGAMMQAMQAMQGAPAPGGQMTEAPAGEIAAAGMNPAQEMPSPEPVPTSQLPMSYGGSMYLRGGKMCGDGGNLYDFGGTMRSIGSGAYGIGEGLLDTLTFGLTDSLTDKGYDALSNIGNQSAEDKQRNDMIRGFGNTAGAVGGAIVSGGAATGSAVSEGAEGLGAGLTNIKGTGAKFDNTVNALAQVGSMAGGLVGGNPAAAAQAPQFAQTLMTAGQNPMLNQGLGMMGMRKQGGPLYHQYPPASTHWKNNAGPMGQGLANTQVYAMGGHMYDGITNPSGFLNLTSPDLVPVLGTDGTALTSTGENMMWSSGTMPTATTANNTANNSSNNSSNNYNVDTTLTDTTQDLSVTGTPLGMLTNVAPIAYNLYQGLKKPRTYTPSDFYVSQEAIRPDYTQAENEARYTYAQLMNSLGAAGMGGGNYMANAQQAANLRNKGMADVAMAEENAYLQDKVRVREANAGRETDAKKLALQTNWAQKTAQQEHIKEALTQAKGITDMNLRNKLGYTYAVLDAPDISKFKKIGYSPYGEYFMNKYFKG